MALGTADARRHDDGHGPGRSEKTERLGGARADFAANLGRRAAEIGGLLDALGADGRAARPRDDLRRRVHALAAGAKLLRFRKLGTVLRAAEERLDAAARRGDVSADDVVALRSLVATMADLAWGGGDDERVTVSLDAAAAKLEPGDLRAHQAGTVADVRPVAPLTALVVGSDALGKTLSMPDVDEGEGQPVWEIERTYDATSAIDLARALAPDLVVVDAELPAARELVEALSQDPLVEAVPVVVVGRFHRPEDAGPYLALGVARTLPKPVSPGALREACKVALSAYGRREARRDPLGSLRVDQLGARLAEELRRGLSDAAEGKGRGVTIELGDGTEVLAALWGAVARIRDVVTIQSKGAVRFAPGGPEGALPFAPWLGPDGEGGGTRGASAPRGAAEGSLDRCTILVADDDPSITWFLAGVFKAAGATVLEARDGAQALALAKHRAPDLVVTDVLMPHLDGFSLCRALKRDVVLRDVPVVLLSWKEDLLQRVRELGADADGYLRKEASAGVIVQRVRELMRRRRRVRERIASGGEVKGRLDGLSAATLLRFACELRPSSTLTLRDATFLYEIEIRAGRPVRATRTAIDGTFHRGSTVLASILGAGDGRFVVTPAMEVVGSGPRAELDGDLHEQLLPLIAGARAAQSLVSGESLVRVDRVGLEDELLAAYLAATPEPSRALLRSFARGASPRTMMVEGQVAPALLESVLVDAAAHGAVFEVIDPQGEDLLPAAIDRELAICRGQRVLAPIPEPLLPEPAELSAMPPLATPIPALVAAALSSEASQPRASAPPPPPSPSPARVAISPAPGPVSHVAALRSEPEASPSSGPVAVLPAIPRAPSVPTDLGAILAPSPSPAAAWPALTAPETPPRSRSIPASPPIPTLREASPSAPPARAIAASPAPSAVPSVLVPSVPAPPVAERPAVGKREAFGPTSPLPARAATAAVPPPPGLKPMLTLGSLTPPPVHPAPASAAPVAKPPRNTKSPKPSPVAAKPRPDESPEPPSYDRRRFPLPSMYASQQLPAAPRKHTGLWVACAIAGIVFAVWARSSRQKIEEPTPPPPVAAAPVVEAPPPAAEEPPADAAPAEGSTEEDGVEDLPLRKGQELKKGQGLLEVVTGKTDTIYVDGKALGSGPTVSVPLRAKDEPYELKVKQRGEERVRKIVVREGRIARVRLAPPWQR